MLAPLYTVGGSCPLPINVISTCKGCMSLDGLWMIPHLDKLLLPQLHTAQCTYGRPGETDRPLTFTHRPSRPSPLP